MSKKIKTEQESRKHLIEWARDNGTEEQLIKIFNRYDDLLKGCKTSEEKEAIQAMGVLEIHSFFSGNSNDGGTLTINGKKIK